MDLNNSKLTPPKRPSNFNFAYKEKDTKPMTQISSSFPASKSVVGTERVQEKTVRPKNVKLIVISSVAFVVALIIAISFTLIFVNPSSSRMKDINISFDTSATFEPIYVGEEGDEQKRYVMPGSEVQCTFTIESQENSESDTTTNLDVFVRFKVYFETVDEYFSSISLNFVKGDMWYKAVDGYYYLTKGFDNEKGVLSPGDKIEIENGFTIDKNLGNEYQGKTIKVMFDCQALQANYQAIRELWPTAPVQWASQYKDLV